MELSKKELEIFEKINLYERHKNLSNQYRYEDKLKNYSSDETINEMKFYFHFSLEYGMVEIIMGMMDKNKKNIIGGLVPNICKKIEIVKNEKKGDIKKARFRNYEDLKNILREYFLIYEDLKTEVLKVDWEKESDL